MKNIIHFFKGIFIGLAVVIPGLSGSIFAVAVGLYEKMLEAVNNLRKSPKESILFLLPIVLGAVVGILASTKFILWVCENYPRQSYIFFIGLVLGSIPIILKKVKKIPFKPQYLILTVLAFAVIVFISLTFGANEGTDQYVAISRIGNPLDFLVIVFAGIFSCGMMSIPGVSGSVMLMIINQYGSVYNAVGNVTDFLKLAVKGDWSAAFGTLQSIFIVVPFIIGAIGGFLLIAKFLGFLLKKYEALTYYAVGGLIAGAVVSLFKLGVMRDSHLFEFSNPGMALLLVLLDIVLLAVGIFCSIVFKDSEEKA